MRSRSVVTALLSFTAGVAVSVVARRLAGGRRTAMPVARPVTAPAAAPTAVAGPVAEVPADRQAVVLPFSRPVPAAPDRPAAPARCGESGGRTKAGAPCASRATSGGRCHHHRVAA
jgi:hypothetical protein